MKKIIPILFFYFFINSAWANIPNAETSDPVPKKWIMLKKELKSRKNPLTSPIVAKKLQRIYRIMGKKNLEDQALELIKKLEGVVKNRPHELAKIYSLNAQIYSGKDDPAKAILFYKKAIRLQTLSYKNHLSTLYSMAFSYLLQNKIKEASKLVDQLFYLSDEIPPSYYILKAWILVEEKKKQQALSLVMKAINALSHPRESWLAFAASLEIELKHYKSAIQILNQLTDSYPSKKKYWKQLSALYLQLNKDTEALSSLNLSYKLEFLSKEKEILHLASLLMYQGRPLKAAKLIKKAMDLKKVKKNEKNYETLANCYMRAEETKLALKFYEIAIATSQKSDTFSKIGHIYFHRETWKQAVKYFELALDKGGVKRPERLYIPIGIAYFNLKKYDKAIQSFEKVVATEAKGQLIKMAREWINYINKEKASSKM